MKTLVILIMCIAPITVMTSGCITQPLVKRQMDDLRNFRVIESTDTRIWISIDYSHFSYHDSGPVWIAAYAMKNDDQIGWFGYAPMKIKKGKGNVVVGLTFIPRNGPSEISTEKVKITMYGGGKAGFYSEVFHYPKTWRTISKMNAVPVTRPSITSRPDTTLSDDFMNFKVTGSTDSQIWISIDYSYFSEQEDDRTYVGAYALNNDEEIRWFGYVPMQISHGRGNAGVNLIFLSKNGPPEITTDKVKMVMYIGGKWPFYSESFDYPKKWKR